MRFIVYGAGAVGGAIGALLSGAGFEVMLIARGQHLAALQESGLRLQLPAEERWYDLPAVAGPAEIDWQPADVVLLTVKSGDTEAALRDLALHADPRVTIVCAQNGVANEPAALRMFAHVYGMSVVFPATHLVPGVVAVHSAPVPGILDLGRYPGRRGKESGKPDGVAEQIAQALRNAGFMSTPRDDIMTWKHTKLLGNIGNAVTAVCGLGVDVDEIYQLIRAEGEQVLTAAGIPYFSQEVDRAMRGDTLQVGSAVGQPRQGGSSWQSLTRGTGSIEADHLNGEIVLQGRLHGVPTPYNEHARRLANRAAAQGWQPGAVTVAQWLSLMEQEDEGDQA
jgi:2-dehydropantoate 2-reductase